MFIYLLVPNKSSVASVLTDLVTRDASMASSMELYEYNIDKLAERSEVNKVIMNRVNEILQLEMALPAAKRALTFEINELKEMRLVNLSMGNEMRRHLTLWNMSWVAYALALLAWINVNPMNDLSGNDKTKMTIANMPTTLQTKKVLHETPSKGIEIRKEKSKGVSKRSEPSWWGAREIVACCKWFRSTLSTIRVLDRFRVDCTS